MPIWDADKLAAIIEHTPTKAQHVSLAVAIGVGLGGTQASTSRTMWRHPEAIYAHHFEQSAAWGYGLSEAGQIIVTATATASADSDDDQPQDTAPE